MRKMTTMRDRYLIYQNSFGLEEDIEVEKALSGEKVTIPKGFIAHRYSNIYFIFSNCESLEDVNCKVLEWLSRAADKGIPYSQDWRNKIMLDGINMFLHTDFSFERIRKCGLKKI